MFDTALCGEDVMKKNYSYSFDYGFCANCYF